ncbi:MAG: hypothetical protein GC190_10680 [Alphaproteobacteria bacterium]|nr:hypothetical protein [Alphaproteobacteria bacterium]
MTKTIARDRSREVALGFLYWLTFLVALEPGNLLKAADGFALGNEMLRIGGAAGLGALSAPPALALARRFPLERGSPLAAYIAIHVASAAALSFLLIAISCALAPILGVGDTRPFLTALPTQLQANWLLLACCILAFEGLAQRPWLVARDKEPGTTPSPPTVSFLERVEVKTSGAARMLSLRDVAWVETQGNYLALHTTTGTHLIRETLTRFESQIDPGAFARIHRRTLVAIDRVRDVHALGNGDALVHLEDGTRLRMSRSFGKQFKSALDAKSCGGAQS